jgi:hypothetical protein
MAAYVYLIEEEPHPGETTGPWTKIGYSGNPPEWRLYANLNYGNSRNLCLRAAFEFDSVETAVIAEQNAHDAFREHIHQKEWFRILWQQVSHWFLRLGAKLRREDTDAL